MQQLRSKTQSLLLTLIAGLIFTSTAFGTATIVIENGDAAGVGFNDSTPAAPVGGNPGTTVGQQRLNAFQFAANVWGAALNSGPTITIHASWAPLACSASSGTLGSAGAVSIFRDFPGSVPGTWYGEALANALSNNNLNASATEISAQFNMSVGSPGCLETLHWYYGLDTNTGAGGINLVAVLLHEFSHGLGFQTFTNSGTGAQASGFPSIYDRFLFDNTTARIWPQMTDAERAASAINTNHLVWNGPQVVADAPTVLGTPRLRVNSPPAIAGNYQVGTADFGAQLTTAGVTGGVIQALDPADGAGPVTTDACSPLTNAAAVSGNIALIDRGSCDFIVKVKNAQDAGAIGVIIADNVAGSPPPALGGSDPTITIPAVRITMADGNTIKAQLGSGVNATLLIDGSAPAGADSSGRPRLYAPNPVQGGSSVSHWDTSLFPNQLMEPSINSDLTQSVTPPEDLTFSLMKDIGWCTCPTPSPSPSPSPPANNDFANAQIISGCVGGANGTNVAANKETGEPSHSPDNDPGGHSVWYRWAAPAAGSVTITTAGSDYDTLLAVYTGNSVNTLTTIVKNDDVNPGGGDFSSSVTFSATAGTTYKIAVDGWNGDAGNISLNWFSSSCPDNTINGLTPRAGRTSGGQQVKIFGPFANVSAVMVGGVSASWSYTNGTSEITVTTPPHAVGAVNIDIVPVSGPTTTKSNAFAYLPTVFTDDALVILVTTAKAQHILELRQAVDALRAVAGLGPVSWTDVVLVPGGAIVKAAHITELRTNLENTAWLLGYSIQSYTDPSLTGSFAIKRVHMEELRQRIRNIAG